jgi:lysozyme
MPEKSRRHAPCYSGDMIRRSLVSSSVAICLLAGLGLVFEVSTTGCSGNSDTNADASAGAVDGGFDTSTILDEYEATGDIPDTEGAITKIAFLDSTTYVLKKTTGSTDGEQLAWEWGTYKIDAAAGTLELTDSSTGTTRSLPFEATPPASESVGSDLHVLGGSLTNGGSQQLTYTLTCTIKIGGQTFLGLSVSCTLTSSGGSGSGSGVALTSGSSRALTSASGSGTALTSGGGSSGTQLTGGGGSGTGTGTGTSPTGGGGTSSTGTSPTGGGGTSSTGAPLTGGGSSSGGGTSLTGGGADGGAPLTMASGQGIDISHWDGSINWSQVKQAGKSFGYAKATESTGYTDPTFAKNYAGMKAQGIKAGAYHFFNAKTDPTAQAMHFISVLKSAGFNASTDLPPALDLEAVPGLGTSSAAAMRTFVSVVQQQLNLTLTIYTDSGDWARIGNPNMASNPLWIAYVNKNGAMSTASAPRMPPGWANYTIWQNSWVGKVTGINAKVDLDYAPLVAGGN